MKDNHPFQPYIPENSTKLIIGTIPPKRFCVSAENLQKDDVYFYYGSKDNSFWNLLGDIFKYDFLKINTIEAINQRKDFLKKHNIGITDLINSCKRNNDLATDDNLDDIEYKDILFLLQKYKNITTLIYTSEFVKKCMNKIVKTHHSFNYPDKKRQTLKINEKEYNIIILYSPSRRALRNMGKNGQLKRRIQYENIFKACK
jgi:hypoxanthine-DNA glycosylase